MSSPKGNLILVAGGAGFLGSHLCDALLRSGARVICLDSMLTGRRSNLRHLEHSPEFELIEADVLDDLPDWLGRVRLSEIYNLACAASPPQYQSDPEHTMLTSVVGTRNLLRLAEKTGARFLLASTSEVYGDPEHHPQEETYRGNVSLTGPRACYDEGKRAAEALVYDFARLRRCDVRVARIFNTYGPRMRPDDGRVISNIICQALTNAAVTIYGDGSQTRSFSYVDDLVDGLMRLMKHDAGEIGPINLGNPNEITISELVARVLDMTSSRSAIVSCPLPTDDPRRRRPDIGRAITLLGWEPRTSLEHGLRSTVAWFQEELARPGSEADCESLPSYEMPRAAAAKSLGEHAI